MINPPTDLDRCLLILLMRAAGCSWEVTSETVGCAKAVVGIVEKWFKEEISVDEARRVCSDDVVKRIINRDLTTVPEPDTVGGLKPSHLIKVSQMVGDDVLRHFRPDYIAQLLEELTVDGNRKHLAAIADLLETWKKQLGPLLNHPAYRELHEFQCSVERDGLFTRVLAHCPAVSAKYTEFDDARKQWVEQADAIYREFADLVAKRIRRQTPWVDWVNIISAVGVAFWIADDFIKGQGINLDRHIMPSSKGWETTEARENCQCYCLRLLRKPKMGNLRKNTKNALSQFRKAKDSLNCAIDTALKSSEYARHRCDWCL